MGVRNNDKAVSFLDYCNWIGGGELSLFLETGVRRAKQNLLLTRKHTKSSNRRCAPDYPTRVGNEWEVPSGAAFWPSYFQSLSLARLPLPSPGLHPG